MFTSRIRSIRRKTAITAGFAIAIAAGAVIGAVGTNAVDAASALRGDHARHACFGALMSGNRLDSTLSGLVADGVITAEQQSAIESGVAASREEGPDCNGMGLVRDRTVGKAVLDLLGMDRIDLRQAWIDGKSLSEVASEQGVSRDELITTITDGIETKLATAVEDGRISAEQKTEIMTAIEPRIETAIDAHIGDGLDRLRERRDQSDATTSPVSVSFPNTLVA